ncbi:DNA-binding protein [Flavobacterium sp. P7388]|uniref:DNA-binding protein n=2 Tax=Flavobacterium geliluteum TaxID=2816120 RepID=A0A941AZP2_9FLAO|nr:DNA-binding protein [Flavobacterium geliluteum]
MSDNVTKDDLRQFGLLLLNDIRKIIDESKTDEKESQDSEWLKSRVARKLMDMSAGSLQNLRVTGKVRFKKVLGSYYYNKTDLRKLFEQE